MKIPKIPNLMTLIALNNLLVPSPPYTRIWPKHFLHYFTIPLRNLHDDTFEVL